MRYLLTILALIGVAHAQPLFHGQGVSGAYTPYTPPAEIVDTILVKWNSVTANTNNPTPGYNNIAVASPNTAGTNLTWAIAGTASGIGISFPQSNTGLTQDNGSGYCPSPTSGFPSLAHRFMIYDGSGANPKTFTISGLPATTTTVDIYFLSSRTTANTINNNRITSGAQTSTANAKSNCSSAMVLTGLVPTSNTITFTLQYITESGSGANHYANAAKIVVRRTP